MGEQNRTIIGIFVALAVIIAAVVGWWYLGRDEVEESLEPAVSITPTPVPEPSKLVAGQSSLPVSEVRSQHCRSVKATQSRRESSSSSFGTKIWWQRPNSRSEKPSPPKHTQGRYVSRPMSRSEKRIVW